MHRSFIAASLLCVACSGSSGSSSPSLYGNWVYENGTVGQGLTLKADGTYVALVLAEVSPTSADAQVETGTFVVNGSTITATPTQWSCRGADPSATYAFSFNGEDLVISDASGVIVYQPNNATGSSSFAITIGCFDSQTGAFKPQPLAPVGN